MNECASLGGVYSKLDLIREQSSAKVSQMTSFSLNINTIER